MNNSFIVVIFTSIVHVILLSAYIFYCIKNEEYRAFVLSKDFYKNALMAVLLGFFVGIPGFGLSYYDFGIIAKAIAKAAVVSIFMALIVFIVAKEFYGALWWRFLLEK